MSKEKEDFKKYVVSYGIGDHQCIGKNFAQVERKLFAVLLLRNYKLKLVKDSLKRGRPGQVQVRISRIKST